MRDYDVLFDLVARARQAKDIAEKMHRVAIAYGKLKENDDPFRDETLDFPGQMRWVLATLDDVAIRLSLYEHLFERLRGE